MTITSEDRQLMTREFAEVLVGKTPHPYLRVHDPAQQALVALAQWDCNQGGRAGVRPYLERMIHFWREISVAGVPCGGRAMDECYALLFECAFELAQSEGEWATNALATQSGADVHVNALRHFASEMRNANLSHTDLAAAFTQLYAPRREQADKWNNPVNVALAGELWFWSAVRLAVGTDESDKLWPFRCAISKSAAANWSDADRLHIRLIRKAPRRAASASIRELMAHPLLRIARLKYREGSTEQTEVLRFLNGRCIQAGFESEEDYFGSDLILAQWARDARHWATDQSRCERGAYQTLIDEAGEDSVVRTQQFFHRHLGQNPEQLDALDSTAALMRWAKNLRGFEFSEYRAQLWEFAVEIVDASLWLGWLFPAGDRPPIEREATAATANSAI